VCELILSRLICGGQNKVGKKKCLQRFNLSVEPRCQADFYPFSTQNFYQQRMDKILDLPLSAIINSAHLYLITMLNEIAAVNLI